MNGSFGARAEAVIAECLVRFSEDVYYVLNIKDVTQGNTMGRTVVVGAYITGITSV